jgi:predicted transposase YbfD/YdcC
MYQNTEPSLDGQALINAFLPLRDPRTRGRCLHRLVDIIFIAICAILCGAKHWNEIEEFGRQRISWLGQYIKIENGIPSHQTFCRVFSLIPPEDMLACFIEWSVSKTKLNQNDIIAIDGKTLRKSGNESANQSPLHLINAYITNSGITIGSAKTPDKSNEIKGIPILLKSLPIANCIITIGAIGTQKGIANLIILKGANYVLALKNNHKKLFKKVKNIFETAEKLQYQAMVYKENTTCDYDHSRYERREYTFLPIMYLPFEKESWKGLQTFIRVKSIRHIGNNMEESFRYYISSIELKNYLLIAKSIREHWHIENRLHWKLDVVMQEDASRIHHPYSAENFSTLRKLVLQLLEKDQSTAHGIAFKQWKAALSCSYLNSLIIS